MICSKRWSDWCRCVYAGIYICAAGIASVDR